MQLAAYLNDHLSGSTAALELLEHLEEGHPELAPSLSDLRLEIEADRAELEKLVESIGSGQSTVRQAAAWVAEKMVRLKMKVDDFSGDRLELLESLEALAIGIHGKGCLWRALETVPAASGPDYRNLIRRADEQREQIEPLRLKAAKQAFVADGPG